MALIGLLIALIVGILSGGTTFALPHPEAATWTDPTVLVALEYTGRPGCGPIHDESCLVIVRTDFTVENLIP